jgi:hypothetical protein
MSLSKVHGCLMSSPWFFFPLVFQVPISSLRGTNVRKTWTLEGPELLEPGESAKPTGAVGSADLVEEEAKSAKPTSDAGCGWPSRLV